MNTPETMKANREAIEAVTLSIEALYREVTPLDMMSEKARANSVIVLISDITTVDKNIATFYLDKLFQV